VAGGQGFDRQLRSVASGVEGGLPFCVYAKELDLTDPPAGVKGGVGYARIWLVRHEALSMEEDDLLHMRLRVAPVEG